MKIFYLYFLKSFIYCGISLISLKGLSQINLTNTENYIYVFEPTDPVTSVGQSTPGHHSVQYFDGLGRPKQVIQIQSSTSEKDIITRIEYDEFGRQIQDFLPIPSEQNNGAYIQNDLVNGSYYTMKYGENTWFSEREIESSPLNRVLKQAAPGEDWALGNGKEIKFEYLTNSQSDQVPYLYVTPSIVTGWTEYYPNIREKGYYGSNLLYKTITTDENGKKIEEFKTKKGQIILKRTYDGTERLDTNYVYDEFGNLAFVLPPLASVNINAVVTNNVFRQNLCYQYVYDDKNRLIEKILPGKGPEYMLYDKQNRLVATQDAVQRTSQKWLFTKYDQYSRVAYTGIVTGTRSNIINLINAAGSNNTVRDNNTGFSKNGLLVSYTVSGFPNSASSINELLTVNYYDDYKFKNPPSIPEEIFDVDVITHNPNNSTQNITTKSLLTASIVRVLGSNSWEKTYNYYDAKLRTIGVHKFNHTNGYTKIENLYDFRGKILQTLTKHRPNNLINEIVTEEKFTYTPNEQLLSHTHKVGSNPEELISKMVYDELGMTESKKVGGTDLTGATGRLQHIEYEYNIRGWLTDINNVNETMGSGIDDLFAFKINYNNLDFGGDGAVDKLYNGNISQAFWRSASNNVIRGYSYEYDDLNRLKHAHFNIPLNRTSSYYSESFDEVLSYDKNGNIKTLIRNLEDPSNGLAIDMDNLTYTYAPDSNKLVKVEDSTNNTLGFTNGANSSIEYTYDVNGNMISDLNKGIASISYNHLNLPTEIVFSGSSTKKINYLYNAAGVKIQKKVTNGSTVTTTDYRDGFQYFNNVLQFFPTAEGYVKNTVVNNQNTYDYVYNYTDHLGNIRVSYMKDPSTGNLKILEENHYYPFGLKHSRYAPLVGRMSAINNDTDKAIVPINPNDQFARQSVYKYKLNGKEYQDELGLNVYAFGFRDYDPALGRWNVIDQLSEMYHTTSPYAFVQNNPLINREIDGRYFEEGSKSERQAARIERRADRRAGNLERKADRLDSQGKSTKDLRDRAGELRQSAQDVRDMRNDQSTEYKYASVNGKQAKSLGVEGPATVGTGANGNGHQVVTMFTEKNMGNQIHETRHGGQHSRGEIDAVNQVSSINAEVSAYRAQYSWNGSLQLPTLDVNSISNIVDFQTNILNRVLLDNGRFPTQVNTTNVTNIGQINRSLIQNIVEIGVAGGSGSLPTVQNYLLWIYAPLP